MKVKLALLTALCLAAVLVSAGLRVNQPSRPGPTNGHSTPIPSDAVVIPRAASIPDIRGDLFGQSIPPPQPIAAKTTSKKAPAAVAPIPPDPLAGYTYTGMVSRDGVTYALLEDKKTKEGVFVKIGDVFQGFVVDAIRPDGITFKSPEPR